MRFCVFVRSFAGKKGDLDASKGDGVKSTTERKTKALTGHEKLVALEKARSFKSKRPFVKILIQPSYARQNGVVSFVLQTFDNYLINRKIYAFIFILTQVIFFLLCSLYTDRSIQVCEQVSREQV